MGYLEDRAEAEAKKKLDKEGVKAVSKVIKEGLVEGTQTANNETGFDSNKLARAAVDQVLGQYPLKEKYLQKAADYLKEHVINAMDVNHDQLVTRDEVKAYRDALPKKGQLADKGPGL